LIKPESRKEGNEMGIKFRDTGATQRTVDPKSLAQALGAEESGTEIDTRQGPISLYGIRQHLVERLRSTGGRPTLMGRKQQRNKVPFLEEDWNKLMEIAKLLKEEKNMRVTPAQIASILIHITLPEISTMEMVERIEGKVEATSDKRTVE
jgi:hypothetical protein